MDKQFLAPLKQTEKITRSKFTPLCPIITSAELKFANSFAKKPPAKNLNH